MPVDGLPKPRSILSDRAGTSSANRTCARSGYSYEIKVVRGQLSMPWTWPTRRRDRAEVRRLSGKHGVPLLVLDDERVVAGSATIARWAAEHPATTRRA